MLIWCHICSYQKKVSPLYEIQCRFAFFFKWCQHLNSKTFSWECDIRYLTPSSLVWLAFKTLISKESLKIKIKFFQKSIKSNENPLEIEFKCVYKVNNNNKLVFIALMALFDVYKSVFFFTAILLSFFFFSLSFLILEKREKTL